MSRRATLALALAASLAGCKKTEPPPPPAERPAPAPAAKPAAPAAPTAGGLQAITAQALGTNLLANGDAETQVEGQSLPGWAAAPDSVGWDSEDYGHTSGEFEAEHPPFAGSGKRYFRCSTEAEKHCRSVQRFSLEPLAADADAGKLKVELAGWFGSFGDNDASAVLEARLLDAAGKPLGQGATEPSKYADRAKPSYGEAAMSRKSASLDVPKGARTLELTLRDGGPADSHADAYFADALEVHLRKAP